MKHEEDLHWADEKEAIKSNIPLKLIIGLFKILPAWLIRILVYPISFFFYIFAPRARVEAKRFQNQLKEYSNGEVPKKISGYRQTLSFAFSMLEKIQGWLGLINYNNVELQDDDSVNLIEQLKQSKGTVIVTSHLGNIELVRCLYNHYEEYVGKTVPIVVLMEIGTSAQFIKTLNEINPGFMDNVIDTADIGPDTVCRLMEELDNGAIIIIAGDRTSAHARDKVIVSDFLGKPAKFPYGTYLLPFLLGSTVYYSFGIRDRFAIFNPKYKIHIEKSEIDTQCGRKDREKNITALNKEFIEKIEKYVKKYPYQWYNFHNFWNM